MERSFTNRMRQSTVCLVFHDSHRCNVILRIRLRLGRPGCRSMPPASKPVKAKSPTLFGAGVRRGSRAGGGLVGCQPEFPNSRICRSPRRDSACHSVRQR